MVQFIQVCEEKIYGNKIWINLDSITSFSRDKMYSINEGQWYKITLNNGSICYTLYNLMTSVVYTLPDY